MLLTLDQRNFFEENGYFILDEAFDNKDIKDFKSTFLSILSSVLKRAEREFPNLKEVSMGKNGDSAILALYNTAPEYISIFQRIISRTPEFFRLSSSTNLFKTIRELMQIEGESGLYLLSNGIILTNSSASTNTQSHNMQKDWHQDTFYTIPENQYVTIWGPMLQKSTQSMGTLIVCPGSHKNGNGHQIFRPELSYSYRYGMAPGEAEQYNQLAIELEVGQMLILHGQLIHTSGPHAESRKARVSFVGICHNAEKETCVPVSTHYLYHKKTPEAWFYELYKDEKAKEVMYDQLATSGEPIGGV